MLGPLVLNQSLQNQSNKRHTSVEPNSFNHGKQMMNGSNGLMIPNGMNNGKVYRRQSQDTNANGQQINYTHSHSANQ